MWTFLAVSIIAFNTTAFFMQKRLPCYRLYVTVLFALIFAFMVDIFVAFPYRLWGFFYVEKIEVSTLLLYLGIYPAVAAMIINWYPYESTRKNKFLYLMAWTIFSTCYEWLTLKFGVLWHMNWNLFYSFLVYPFLFYILIIHVRLSRKLTLQ